MQSKKYWSRVFLVFASCCLICGFLLSTGLSAAGLKDLKPVPFLSSIVNSGQGTMAFAPQAMPLAPQAMAMGPAPLAAGAGCPRGRDIIVDAAKGPIFDIQTAVDMASDGDKIKVRPGVYAGFEVYGKNCLEIDGENDKTIITGGALRSDLYTSTYLVTIFVYNSQNIVLKDLKVMDDLDEIGIWCGSGTSGKIEHCDIAAGAEAANSLLGAAVMIWGVGSPSAVSVKDFKVHDFGVLGIGAYSPGTSAVIENNEIKGYVSNDSGSGIGGIVVAIGASATIKNNKISNMTSEDSFSSAGIYAIGGAVDMENNEIENCQVGLWTQAFNGATLSVPVVRSKNDKIRDCTTSYGQGVGMFLKDTDMNTLIQNAHIWNNDIGIYQMNNGDLVGGTFAKFKEGDLRLNFVYDVIQDPEYGDVTIYYHNTKWNTREVVGSTFTAYMLKY